MLESQFKPNLQKKEQGEFEPTPLDTVRLSEIPVHEGIETETKVEIAKKIVRLEELKKGSRPKFKNEKNILSAGLHNLVVQERLSQADGPLSLSRSDFKSFIAKQSQALADEYFRDSAWNGIATTTRAVELDAERNDDLLDKQIIFCDLLDANDATDYILIGRNADTEEPRFTFKFVQVGTLEGDKSPSDIKDQHVSLARRLSNETSPEKFFEQNEDAIIGFIKEVAEKLPEEDISFKSVVDVLLETHFGTTDRGEPLEREDIMKGLSSHERELFTDDMEKFIYFAQKDFSPESRQALIQDIASEIGLDENTAEEFVLLISNTFDSPQLLRSVPVDFVSRTMIRFKNEGSKAGDGDKVNKQENFRLKDNDIPLNEVDGNIIPMYYVDELELSNLIEANIYGKSKQDKEDAA